MRRRNGDIFPGLVNERRYTTTELLTIEQRIIDRAQNGIAAERWTVPEAQVEAALATRPNLTDGQRAMIRQFATSGNASTSALERPGPARRPSWPSSRNSPPKLEPP